MRKFYFYLMSQMLLAGSLLFSSQNFCKEDLNLYSDSDQIERIQSEFLSANNAISQAIYRDNPSMIYLTPKGVSLNIGESMDLDAILKLCEKSIVDVVYDKVYLNLNNLLICQGYYLLLNDQQQWMRLEEIFKDDFGFYIRAKDLNCDEGHVAFRKVGGIWYCLKEGCPYYYLDHFN